MITFTINYLLGSIANGFLSFLVTPSSLSYGCNIWLLSLVCWNLQLTLATYLSWCSSFITSFDFWYPFVGVHILSYISVGSVLGFLASGFIIILFNYLLLLYKTHVTLIICYNLLSEGAALVFYKTYLWIISLVLIFYNILYVTLETSTSNLSLFWCIILYVHYVYSISITT